METRGIKAICLLSGGLDSSLAMKILREQGIEIIAVNFVGPFCLCSKGSCGSPALKVAKSVGVPVMVVALGEDYLEIVRHPKYGYGSNLNPCIDCRIHMFKKAKEIMETEGASFIITGEVVGQRPMSQRPDVMKKIDRDSGLEGLIVRPLSARVLEPTIPEINGWVRREELLAISGRSRKEQMRLAEDRGLEGYSCPGGGCLLTDPRFAMRAKDLLEHGSLTMHNVALLRIGRHFRLPLGSKLVVGRDEADNNALSAKARPEDIVLMTDDCPGPTALLIGEHASKEEQLAASIAARYSDRRTLGKVRVRITSQRGERLREVSPLDPEQVKVLMI